MYLINPRIMKIGKNLPLKQLMVGCLVAISADVVAQDSRVVANLQAGSAAAQVALAKTTVSAGEMANERRRQAYLLADANEAAARQKILSKLLAAKTAADRDAAMAELEDRWLAAKDGLLKLKAAADAADVGSFSQEGD